MSDYFYSLGAIVDHLEEEDFPFSPWVTWCSMYEEENNM